MDNSYYCKQSEIQFTKIRKNYTVIGTEQKKQLTLIPFFLT